MDAKKVEILLEAVESGSMMGIAGQNGYTPSGLSHLLRRLESFETLEREAALLRNETETTLRLGAYASIAKNWMPAMLRAFGKAYPQIRVELEVLSRQELYRAMKEDRLHLIFACEDQTQPYHFLHLADDPFYAVLPSTEESLQAITLPPLSGEQEDAIPAAKKSAVLQEGARTKQHREEPRAVRLNQHRAPRRREKTRKIKMLRGQRSQKPQLLRGNLKSRILRSIHSSCRPTAKMWKCMRPSHSIRYVQSCCLPARMIP